ncbi:hypothetical protein EO98_04145 [Methanosarcina sp. 2.H.T.1A.6]|uniref:PqqD family peptide modification chaperone n=1 Tax=unclassified Methanosarcina TaxID=2644672 RepID=UPI00062188E5|nr:MULTISPECIES: PqqD family peptide modification chaperone [unclassified Methanosarcina]KKG09568.1 hypothetical protein EO97_00505 [Methanosarcina sp. 2.H.T.1A.15]KKG17567.1 hypothetical protein EO94_11870 [Methanosarcina sp. 2.H.T.1A.3]KKG19470.1 hypothetical protein EO98_04145 [Methanosarcina sp. 2.H.T.1A.6]KKG20940.1 hypothetical protein EO96_07720 [Methanosarcina sp. 2.H.T.1A.8]
MLILNNLNDNDFPYFPYPLQESGNEDDYITTNHLMARPIRLNRQAAEVLRLADGVTQLSDIIGHIVELYPDAGGSEVIKPGVLELLRILTERELIWWRGVPALPVPVQPPQSIFWEITAACNLRCLHCVVGAGPKLEEELSTSKCLELAEELAAFGVKNIAFSGGEPLLRPDFFTIAEKVRELGMGVQVATNGTLITPQIAHHLMNLDADVQVSLDGSRPEIYDILRPGQKAFTKCIEGIQALVAEGHQVTIGTVLSSINIKDIPEIVALTERLGATAFRLIPFVPKGRGQLHKDMEVPLAQVKEIVQYLHDMRERTRLQISPLEFEDMLDGSLCPDPLVPEMPLKCGGAVEYGTITPAGEVLTCHFFEGVRADNIRSASFRDVWYRSRFLNYFRSLRVSDLHGNCSACTWLPRCAGSCRAVNYAKGDLFGGNKSCWASQNTTEARLK